MHRTKRFAVLLLSALLILTVPALAAAGIYHAPVFTVVAPFAPRDMKATVYIIKKDGVIPVVLEARRRGWEMQYRLYRDAAWQISAWYGNAYDLKDAELVFEGGGETKTAAVPAELLSERGVEDYAAFDWRTGRLSAIPQWRAPLLLLMWVMIAVLVEGVIYYIYGYRYKKSWFIFIIINLVTQGLHHMLVSGINLDPNRPKAYIFFIAPLFLFEMLAFVLLVDERSRDRTISFAVVGNLASQAVLGVLLGILPT